MNRRLRIFNVFNRLMPSGAEVMWLSAAEHFRKAGIDHVIVATTDDIGPYGGKMGERFEISHVPLGNEGPWGVWALVRALREAKPDLIHCHSEGKAIATLVAGRIVGVPVVRTYHSVWASTGRRHALRRVFDRHLSHRVTIGRSVHETESRWGDAEMILNWVGVDDWSRASSVAEPSPASTIRLITVCNVHDFKRCDLMLDVVSRHDDVELTHIGYDPLEVFNPEALARRGISDRVRTLGPQDDVVQRLPGYDAFICTSDFEGFGVALYEGLLSGLPLVIVDNPGVRDVLEFAPHALVIDPGSKAPLKGLRSSIDKQRGFFREHAYELRERFSARRGAAEHTALYRRLARK